MKIAIIGAGFCGLAVAWHLFQKKPDLEIVLFDPLGIGGGTSGMAAGLMHPYSGAHAKLNWQGNEGYQATLLLLEAAGKALGEPVADFSGLCRLAITPQQLSDFQLCVEKYPENSWCDVERMRRWFPDVVAYPGLFLPNAVTVKSPLYLKGLWQACQAYSIHLEEERIEKVDTLKGFDAVIITVGAAAKSFQECADLPITAVKGQVLEYVWEETPLRMPINSQTYVLMSSKDSVLVGATYEKQFHTLDPVVEAAKGYILPRTIPYLPQLDQRQLLGCKAGVRASTPDHHPIMKKVGEKSYVLTGMGSKGLLYHGLYAERLSHEILR